MLRHSFAAAAAEMGFSELTIAGLLGHSVPGITARYAHVPDSALVTAADRVAARIAIGARWKGRRRSRPVTKGNQHVMSIRLAELSPSKALGPFNANELLMI